MLKILTTVPYNEISHKSLHLWLMGYTIQIISAEEAMARSDNKELIAEFQRILKSLQEHNQISQEVSTIFNYSAFIISFARQKCTSSFPSDMVLHAS